MPPGLSHRRTRSRLDANLSSPELQSQESPSRQISKRRRVHEDAGNKTASSEDVKINSVIASLLMPPNDVQVAIDHANDKNARDHRDGVTAYAKLSGQNWTFYVKDLRVVIGRPPDARPSGGSVAKDEVDIDLGPSKLVSRHHATIQYDTTGNQSWVLTVEGRNGVRVDDEIHKKGATVRLRSGSMLEIAGVQMLFFLPDQEAVILPQVLGRAEHLQTEAASEDYQHQSFPVASTTKAVRQRKDGHPSSDFDHTRQARPKSTTAGEGHLNELAIASGTISTPGTSVLKSENNLVAVSPSKDTPSQFYHRGVMMESVDDIEYSLDSAKEIKPPYSYATLIAQAILSSEDEKLTLSQIYAWIMERYAFYRHAATGWQNSIRHNLSLNKAFQKIPRRTDEPGKGMKWQIAEDARDEFTKKAHKAPLKSGKASSQASSPASDHKKGHSQSQSRNVNVGTIMSSTDDEDATHSMIARNYPQKTRRSITPPFSGKIMAKEAFTPDRGPGKSGLVGDRRMEAAGIRANSNVKQGIATIHDSHVDDKTRRDPLISSQELSRTPSHRYPGNAISSPYIDEMHDQPMSASAVTPAPQRQHPRLAPPSISQLPSSFLPTSSPAPFWKFMNLSTPARGPDFSSPMKTPALQSSSPPLAPLGSRLRDMGSPLKDRDIFHGGKQSTVSVPAVDEDDVDDLQGFDLSKGFQSIGQFHAEQAAARAQAASSFTNRHFK